MNFQVKKKVGPNILKRYLLKVALDQKEKQLKRFDLYFCKQSLSFS